jgi:hypothetical protein
MNKEKILREIRRTAAENGGVPVGSRKFATLTDIHPADWSGKFWARWGDALQEAGFSPNAMVEAYATSHLLAKLAELTRELGRVPTANDLKLKGRADKSYPNAKVFERLGRKAEVVRQLLDYCNSEASFADVADLCRQYAPRTTMGENANESVPLIGYVYLLRHGAREFKIGMTKNPIRREGEIAIELPQKLQPIHVIATDDPSGVEAYWHRRFAAKRLKNEWFALSAADVSAFKKWRRIA